MPEPVEPAAIIEQFDCPACEVPAGSTCCTRSGKVAPKYHTPRFMLVPQLRAELEVKTPAVRGPGRAWERGPAIDATVPQATTKPTRVGYARCGTAQQELQSQLDALAEAGVRPGLLGRDQHPDQGPPGVRQGDGVRPHHQEGRPPPAGDLHRARDEATGPRRRRAPGHAIAEDLRHHDIELELLTGPLQGV